jgi:Haem-binding domain
MKKALKIVVLVVAVAFVAMQFFRIDTANPPIDDGETLESAVNVPPDISLILGRSCNDCHSHKTIYPWYINIQPGGWFMKDHVEHGKEHLNFSVFNTYDKKKQAHKLEEICEMVESKAMPLPSYLWLHGDAVLADSEGRALCAWANQEAAKIAQ